MNIISLTLNGILVAAMYALGRAAARDGMSPLGLLYWQALSSAVIVSAMALLSGDRPRFPRRYLPRYAMAVIAGVSPVPLTASAGSRDSCRACCSQASFLCFSWPLAAATGRLACRG